MKISQDLILGVAIGAAVGFALAKASKSSAPVQPTLPTRKQIPTLPQNALYGFRRIGIRPWDTPWSQARPVHA